MSELRNILSIVKQRRRRRQQEQRWPASSTVSPLSGTSYQKEIYRARTARNSSIS